MTSHLRIYWIITMSRLRDEVRPVFRPRRYAGASWVKSASPDDARTRPRCSLKISATTGLGVLKIMRRRSVDEWRSWLECGGPEESAWLLCGGPGDTPLQDTEFDLSLGTLCWEVFLKLYRSHKEHFYGFPLTFSWIFSEMKRQRFPGLEMKPKHT